MSSETVLNAVYVDDVAIDRVLEPESIAEASRALADANRDGQRLLLSGGRTRLAFGNLGGPFDAVLSTRRLNEVIHYEPDDMTISVQPGCTIRQIKTLLTEHNQVLGLDAAREGDATIGGAVATGLSGPRRLGSGALKDWLIGIEVAGPDGSLSRAGGMVVKNVTGFDMMHVHYGALGAFGLITRVNLKVFPRHARSHAITLRFNDLDTTYASAVALLTSQLQPSSITISNEEGWALHVRCDAPSSAIDRLTDRVLHAASALGAPDSAEVSDDGDAALDSFRAVVDLAAGNAVARLPVPASRQLPVLSSVVAWGEQRVCADIGSGLVYVASIPARAWVESVRGLSGDASFLSLPPELKAGIDVFGPQVSSTVDVVRRLKHAFDPNGTVNRGRFVLGL